MDDDNPDRITDPTKTSTPRQVEETKIELAQAIHGSNEVLASATTVWPFTLFPDVVTIDRAKFTIRKRSFFRVAELMSIRVEDILNCTVNVGPIFGSLEIANRIMGNEKPYQVKFLWRDDALKMKRIVQGYIIAVQKKIDCSPLKTKELADMLNELGKDDHVND